MSQDKVGASAVIKKGDGGKEKNFKKNEIRDFA